MDRAEIDRLVQRLVENPHDEESLAYAHQAGEQCVREANHVRLRLRLEPGDEFVQLSRLIAFLAVQHREGQVADIFRARLGGAAGGESKQGG